MDLSKKQYQKMVGNKPAKKQVHHSLATVMAKKMKKSVDHRDSFMKRLDAHKAEAASFDNGNWKPKYKGQSFIQALEEHKSKRQFD